MLLEFHRQFPDFRPVMVRTKSARGVADPASVEFVEWHDYLAGGVGFRTSWRPLRQCLVSVQRGALGCELDPEGGWGAITTKCRSSGL